MIPKSIIFLLSLYICASSVTSYVVTWTGDDDLILAEATVETTKTTELLGKKMCTRGPAYWCHNITHAKECHAVHHCISNVWEGMTLPEDNDSVCQICKDMVTQARDQLLSNETQEELREVLEGSCRLIPLKIISEECVKLSDEFIPELVDTLASRMDPQAVCAVSGLCNSVRIDEMLGEMKGLIPQPAASTKFDLKTDACPKCNHFLGRAVNFLKQFPEENLLEKLLMVCGRLGSYSDSCTSLALIHIDEIYDHVQSQMNSEEMCGLIGLCEVSSIRRVSIGKPSTAVRAWSPPNNGDNLECDFCKQLVIHVKDWLIANTTREEFGLVIRGLCKQIGSYKTECMSLADEYAKPLYQLLVDETDPDRICGQIGVCLNTSKFQLFGNLKKSTGPIMTILPTGGQRVGNSNDQTSDTAPMLGLLPAERLTGDDEVDVTKVKPTPKGDNIQCDFCTYAAHFLQNYIEEPRTEEKISEAMDRFCNLLPEELGEQCTQFVNDYGKSMIVLLAQRIDPTQICPELGACPKPKHLLGDGTEERERQVIVRKDQRPKGSDVPSCPLCHFAVAKIISIVGQNRTKEAIDRALDSVCYILPKTVESNCCNFMTYYGNQIGEMLVIQLSAREICMALGLCVLPTSSPQKIIPPAANKPLKIVVDSILPFDRFMPPTIVKGEIDHLKEKFPGLHSYLSGQGEEMKFGGDSLETNEIDGSNSKVGGGGNECVICEFAITQIDKRLQDNATEQEIRDTVENACSYLPKTVKMECRSFVEQYSDIIINYLANSLDPAEVCKKIGLCKDNMAVKKNNVETIASREIHKLEGIKNVKLGRCQLCIVVSEYLSAMLEDPKVETSVDKIAEKICPIMPRNYRSECSVMIEDYGPYLMSLLAQATDKGKACSVLDLCPAQQSINHLDELDV